LDGIANINNNDNDDGDGGQNEVVRTPTPTILMQTVIDNDEEGEDDEENNEVCSDTDNDEAGADVVVSEAEKLIFQTNAYLTNLEIDGNHHIHNNNNNDNDNNNNVNDDHHDDKDDMLKNGLIHFNLKDTNPLGPSFNPIAPPPSLENQTGTPWFKKEGPSSLESTTTWPNDKFDHYSSRRQDHSSVKNTNSMKETNLGMTLPNNYYESNDDQTDYDNSNHFIDDDNNKCCCCCLSSN